MRREGSRAFVAGPEIAGKLREANYFVGLPREEFAQRAADLMAELNDVHPFRE